MTSFAIETNGLTKRFRDVTAVDAVDLRVGVGEIYGFLGLNGAGKTTTIRMLLGMIRPSAGNVKILGQAVGPHGHGPWLRVGHLVEHPSAYPELSVQENLEVTRRLHRITDEKVTCAVIEKLNLSEYSSRKAGSLSTGNLQRLGLARALLHDPELLILDEPANGLDPAGLVEIRELLHSLAQDRAVTIFMSSHILTEVDRLATRIGIIHQGRLIEELDTDKLEKLRAKRLEVRTHNLAGALICLQSAGYKPGFEEESIFLEEPHAIDNPDRIAQILVNAGAPPIHLAIRQQDLEEHFMQLTGEADGAEKKL
jgi:ABC-2 type transport system ATP-binding protein